MRYVLKSSLSAVVYIRSWERKNWLDLAIHTEMLWRERCACEVNSHFFSWIFSTLKLGRIKMHFFRPITLRSKTKEKSYPPITKRISRWGSTLSLEAHINMLWWERCAYGRDSLTADMCWLRRCAYDRIALTGDMHWAWTAPQRCTLIFLFKRFWSCKWNEFEGLNSQLVFSLESFYNYNYLFVAHTTYN